MPNERATDMTWAAPGPAAAGTRRSPLRLLLAGAGLVALLAAGRVVGGYVLQFAAWVDSLGAVGPLVFIAGYVIACVAFIPGSLLTLAAGAIFGFGRGVLYVFVGAAIGASAAFLVGRYVARRPVERRLAGNPRFAAIDRAIAREGRKIVTLLRLSPLFPFNLLNYALGLTQVRFADYLLAMVGILPGTVLYVYSGKLAGDVAALAGGVAPARGAGYWAVLGLGLAATVAVTTIVTRAARRALAEVTDGPEGAGR
ncbi:MAG TPA: TVP38/TMEM64 family protein [Gemmatimonadales bacterium]|nr:TVP38/TMEM64 family protein [Gemmatimonadales bacterium]